MHSGRASIGTMSIVMPGAIPATADASNLKAQRGPSHLVPRLEPLDPASMLCHG